MKKISYYSDVKNILVIMKNSVILLIESFSKSLGNFYYRNSGEQE